MGVRSSCYFGRYCLIAFVGKADRLALQLAQHLFNVSLISRCVTDV